MLNNSLTRPLTHSLSGFSVGSPDDPRVPIAVGSIVGLCNGLGVVCFVVVYTIYRVQGRKEKQEAEMTSEKKMAEQEQDDCDERIGETTY